MSTTDPAPQPMDPSTNTGSTESTPQRPRTCHAIKTLVAEVLALTPGVEHITSEPNSRGVDLAVTFMTGDTSNLADLLTSISDPRVADIEPDTDTVTIRFRNSPRTQDLRDSFGLADAWAILVPPATVPEILADLDQQADEPTEPTEPTAPEVISGFPE